MKGTGQEGQEQQVEEEAEEEVLLMDDDDDEEEEEGCKQEEAETGKVVEDGSREGGPAATGQTTEGDNTASEAGMVEIGGGRAGSCGGEGRR